MTLRILERENSEHEHTNKNKDEYKKLISNREKFIDEKLNSMKNVFYKSKLNVRDYVSPLRKP